MKKIAYTIVLVAGMNGASEGMLESQHSYSGQQKRYGYAERNLDVLPGYPLWQEQWEIQRKMTLLQQKIERIIVQASENILFDKGQLLSNINPEIKENFEVLLNESLDGNTDSLALLSERIYNGRLLNRLILNSLVDTLEKRKEIIFQVSLELYRKIPGIGEPLKNIIKYCPEKAKRIGLQDFFDEINELF